MSIEENQVQVLFDIESNIVKIYQQDPDLLDAQLESAIDYLIRVYSAETQGRNAPRKIIRGVASDIADDLYAVCELYRGRAEATTLEGKSIECEVRTAEEMTECLKKLKSSIKTWTKQGGRQGYLNYVTGFIKSMGNNGYA